MAGYLDNFGVEEARRGRQIKRIILWSAVVLIVSTVAYFSLRTFSQERTVKHFLSALEQKNYQDAYKLWGCTPETPCKYYAPEKFNEDWGPDGIYRNASALKVTNVDFCDSGVVFTVSYPNADNFGLWVERDTNVVGFAPWERCPGRHLQLGAFFRRLFSK